MNSEQGLTIFGIDMMFESGTDRAFVIDINYFPGARVHDVISTTDERAHSTTTTRV
jgi:hypothetical protein